MTIHPAARNIVTPPAVGGRPPPLCYSRSRTTIEPIHETNVMGLIALLVLICSGMLWLGATNSWF